MFIRCNADRTTRFVDFIYFLYSTGNNLYISDTLLDFVLGLTGIVQIQRELQLRIEAQGLSLQKMLEQQAKLNHPDLPSGEPSAPANVVVPTPSSLAPSNSSNTTTLLEEQPTGSGLVTHTPSYTDTTMERSKQKQIEAGSTSPTSLDGHAAKRARTDASPQVNLSGQEHNFLAPSTKPSCTWESFSHQSPQFQRLTRTGQDPQYLQTPTSGGSPQQAHADSIPQHPGRAAQKPVQA